MGGVRRAHRRRRRGMTRLVRWCLAVGGVLLAACAIVQAQEAQVTILGNGIVKAGESVDLTLTLENASNFEGSLSVIFRSPGSPNVLGAGGTAKPGERVYHLKVSTPQAARGGVYALAEVQFWDGAAWVDLPHKKDAAITVIANPGLVYPTGAEVQVNPSQIQFLRSAAIRPWRVLEFRAFLT